MRATSKKILTLNSRLFQVRFLRTIRATFRRHDTRRLAIQGHLKVKISKSRENGQLLFYLGYSEFLAKIYLILTDEF
jgi:hypothetical protein